MPRDVHSCQGRPRGTQDGPELVGTLDSPPMSSGSDLCRRSKGAEWLQVRADRVGDLSPSWLRERFPGRLLYTLRSCNIGGRDDSDSPTRAQRLRTAGADHDLVELECERDLRTEVLTWIPPAKRLISWHGPACDMASLAAIFHGLAAVPARYYQLVVTSHHVRDGLAPLEFLRSCGRRDVIAFADGEPGFWSRVLSPYLGSPLVFGSLYASSEGVPSLRRLVEDYGLPDLTALDRLYGIAGDQVAHSLSPRLHNAAYRHLGVPGLFLTFPVVSLAGFWRDLVSTDALEQLGLPLKGLTIASPNKEASMALAAAVSPTARLAGSANLVYNGGNGWVADTTDPVGVLKALARRGLAVAGRRAAVVGCGGSGRAIAVALGRKGASVVLSNRGRPRGEDASRRLGLPLVPLSEFAPEDHDLIVNATPVGRLDGKMPFAVDCLAPGTVLVDLVYAPEPTALSSAARATGAIVVDGREVLQIQSMRQFKKMTNRSMPEDLAIGLLGLDEVR